MFIRRLISFSSATIVAQMVGLFSVPFMSRLFSPEEYAVLTIYLSIIGVLVLVASGRLEVAIPLASEGRVAEHLAALCLIFASVTTAALLVGIYIFEEAILEVLNVPGEPFWLWLAPVGMLSAVLIQVINYWSTRVGCYARIASVKIIAALGYVLLPVFLLFLSPLSGGESLVIGYLLANLAAILVPNLKMFGRVSEFLVSPRFSTRELKRALSINRDFPKHVFSTAFLNGISKVAVFFCLQIFFGQYWAGLLALAERAVLTPLRIAGTSLWQVTHASLANLEDFQKKLIFEKVHFLVSVGFGLPLSVLASLSGYCSRIFGDEWGELETLLPAVCLMGYFNMVSNSTSYFTAFGYFRAESYINVGLVSIRSAALAYGVAFLGASSTVVLFCVTSAFAYMSVNAFWGCRLGCLWVFSRNMLLGGVAPGLLCWVIYKSHMLQTFAVFLAFVATVIYTVFAYRGFQDLKIAVDKPSDKKPI